MPYEKRSCKCLGYFHDKNCSKQPNMTSIGEKMSIECGDCGNKVHDPTCRNFKKHCSICNYKHVVGSCPSLSMGAGCLLCGADGKTHLSWCPDELSNIGVNCTKGPDGTTYHQKGCIHKKTEFTSVKDSGERREFSTGSVRDVRTGKGRYDLIPPGPLLRLAKHYENGAIKYGDRNWEKGQPLSSYADSMLRHCQKYLAGDRSEDHLAAIPWNAFAIIFTEEMLRLGKFPPEFNDMPTSPEARPDYVPTDMPS